MVATPGVSIAGRLKDEAIDDGDAKQIDGASDSGDPRSPIEILGWKKEAHVMRGRYKRKYTMRGRY